MNEREEREPPPLRRARRLPPAKPAPVPRRARRRRSEASVVNVGAVATTTLRVIGRNALPFLLFAGALALPFVAYRIALVEAIWTSETPSGWFSDGTQLAVELLETLVAGLVLQCVLSYGVYAQLSGRRVDFGTSFRGLKSFPAVLGIALLLAFMTYGVLVVAVVLLGAFLGVAGVILGLIPGSIGALAIFCTYYVAIQASIVERVGVAKGMARSAWLTRGNRWAVFGIVLLVYLVPVLLNMFVGEGGNAASSSLEAQRTWVLIASVVGIVFWVFQAVAPAVLYYELRRAKEGVGLDEILTVFD